MDILIMACDEFIYDRQLKSFLFHLTRVVEDRIILDQTVADGPVTQIKCKTFWRDSTYSPPFNKGTMKLGQSF